ncbi:MAG: hypothetical protein FD161_2990 [Limisphaerales bacterium]|nr:MAG: hypothetical protein FD161_2990 [Limisphaerales bacterium]KAG0508103.1 MAG: hypothetical protein E1N63_2697 [Limisphaerales bacterium]TXT53044.1 MAG: hypothetical protein FD140_152 [Limisphaerales bacterium]
MSTQPTPKAWEADEFWSEVVNVITGGKRLRPDHYLASLDAPALESLRLALSSSGTLAEQQKLCPPRSGGRLDGEPPSLRCLSELSSALRQTWMLRRLERQTLIESAAKKRCGDLGLDTRLTDAVCTVVGEEALAQAAHNQVGDFSVKAAQVLMSRQDGKLKAIAEQRKERELELKNRSLDLELEKYRTALKGKVELAMDAFAADLKGNAKLLEAYQRFRAEVGAAMTK